MFSLVAIAACGWSVPAGHAQHTRFAGQERTQKFYDRLSGAREVRSD